MFLCDCLEDCYLVFRLWISLVFPWMSSFCSWIYTEQHVVVICWFPLCCVSLPNFVSMTVLKGTGQVFYRVRLCLTCLKFSWWLDLMSQSFGKEILTFTILFLWERDTHFYYFISLGKRYSLLLFYFFLCKIFNSDICIL
jgi:hypothetical protein